jgi:hypothetical protein
MGAETSWQRSGPQVHGPPCMPYVSRRAAGRPPCGRSGGAPSLPRPRTGDGGGRPPADPQGSQEGRRASTGPREARRASRRVLAQPWPYQGLRWLRIRLKVELHDAHKTGRPPALTHGPAEPQQAHTFISASRRIVGPARRRRPAPGGWPLGAGPGRSGTGLPCGLRSRDRAPIGRRYDGWFMTLP